MSHHTQRMRKYAWTCILIHLKGLNEETQENINVTNTRIERSVWYLLKQYALLVEIVKLKKGSSALPFFFFFTICLISCFFRSPFLDIDECKTNSHDCNANAYCSNTEGSYHCFCKPGYIRNGRSCASKFDTSWGIVRFVDPENLTKSGFLYQALT